MEKTQSALAAVARPKRVASVVGNDDFSDLTGSQATLGKRAVARASQRSLRTASGNEGSAVLVERVG